MKAFKTVALLAVLLLTATSGYAGQSITYYHWDALGSPVLATDEQGNVKWREDYKPYGEKTENQIEAADNTRWYTGHPHDSVTGLTYMGARWYDPAVGRFMAIDPKDFSEKSLHSFNRYAYANNNPYRYWDPDGEEGVATLWLPDDAPLVIAVQGLGRGIAHIQGYVTGDQALIKATEEGMRENFQKNLDASTALMIGIVGGRGGNRLGPVKNAEGPHTTWRVDPRTGKIERHETWEPNPQNPSGWDSVKSTDITGRTHFNKKTGEYVPTPHTQGKDFPGGKDIPGGVRPATPDEIPK